eukprot:s2724_g1.t2
MKAVSTAEEAKSKEDDAKINVTVLTLSGETVATLTLGLQGGRVLEDSETASSLAWPSDVTLTKLVDHTGHAIDLTLELRMTFDYERPIALLRDPKSKTFGAMDADETRRMCAAMKETTQNLNALNYIFNTFGEPSKNGIDVMILLLCFKKKFPGQVHLLRGKHECSSIARIYGFYDECKHRFPTRSGVKLFKQFVEVFDSLPLVAVIQRLWSRVFCVSSGLSPKLEDLEELRKLQRPVEVGSDGLVCDLLWSDPDDHRPGWYEQDKGMSYTYGPDVDFIVHGTQVVDEGHEFFAAGKGVSIFSSPAFLGEFRNKASVLLLDEQLQQSLHTFDETMLPADALPSLHACITMDPSCQELGERLLEELRKQLKLSQSLRKCYGEIEVSTSLLVQGVWSVPQSQAVILLLTPEWLLTPLGAAALRAIFRLRSMQLGPEVLPLVHVNAFPDGPSSALNAPSGQLLREAASSGSWGCLDSNLGAAIPQAAAWAAQRLEIIFVREGAESGEDNTPANLASRRQEATGLTQTTWRRRSHESREKEPVEAVWQDFPQNGAKSPKRPRNMPSLNAGGVKGRNGEERGTDKTSLRHVAENAARHVDDMHQHREGLSRLPRRASEPGLHASISHKGVPKAIVKDWADAMRDVLGVPNAEGAFPEGESNSRRGSKDAPLPPVGDFMQPNSAPVPSEKPRRKSQVIPPLPEKGIRPASGIVRGYGVLQRCWMEQLGFLIRNPFARGLEVTSCAGAELQASPEDLTDCYGLPWPLKLQSLRGRLEASSELEGDVAAFGQVIRQFQWKVRAFQFADSRGEVQLLGRVADEPGSFTHTIRISPRDAGSRVESTVQYAPSAPLQTLLNALGGRFSQHEGNVTMLRRLGGLADGDVARESLTRLSGIKGDGPQVKVLEIGCGSGRWAKSLFPDGSDAPVSQYLGVDYSTTMSNESARCLSQIQTARVVRGDARRDGLLAEACASFFGAPDSFWTAGSKSKGALMELWESIWQTAPTVVGGCKPKDIRAKLQSLGWQVIATEVTDVLGYRSQVKGECRRQWRVQELTLDDSFEEDLPPALQAAATVRHWAALALEKRPRTPGRDADEPQSAPATPHGRDQGWDHFGLLSTGFYLAEAMSPSAMRGIGVGIAAPDPFTGGTALSWEKTEDMDPSASWWGTHPAETQQGWQSQAEVTKEACQQPAAEGGVEGEGQTEETTEFTKRNQASKVDAMMSLQVELPPLPASNGTRSNDQLISGAVLPSEKKHVDMSFGSLEMATQLVHAKGGGSHGPKFIALNLKLNRRVVCWRFVAPKHLEMARRALLQDSVTEEVQHLQTLRHPCICPYYAGEVVDGQLYVVTGYAPGGSVADWLADAGPLAEAPTQRVVRSVLEGLRYLHSHDVAHGAIRGGNVLLGPGSAIRLCDFGLSTLREGSVAGSVPKGKTSESSALSQSAVPWMAPEVLQGLIPTASSDIWSLACLVAGELGWERCPQHRPGEVSGSCMQKGRRWFFKVQGPINTAIQANDLWPLPEAIAKAGYGFPMQK